MKTEILSFCAAALTLLPLPADGCTGITLTAQDGSHIVARTIEWGGSNLNSRYVVVPRGYRQTSLLPGGKAEGLTFEARYGYVGLAVEQDEFVAEGINEAGLSAGLFYFPNYGEYVPYDPDRQAASIADLQLVSWMLARFGSVDEVMKGIGEVRVVGIDPRASTAHWRIADPSGRQVVLEITEQTVHFYENKLGVLTNAPGFEWHLTNLNNYVNLRPGTAQPQPLGGAQLASFGAGSLLLGIPGDVTPPSRFVRAAFYQATAPQQPDAESTVRQSFQLLNSFDIPIGIEFAEGAIPADIPSATQWTSATDLTHRAIYFRTMYDSAIRCIDLRQIDFGRVAYQVHPLDSGKQGFVPIAIGADDRRE